MLHLISKKRKNATDTYQNRSRKSKIQLLKKKKEEKTGHKMMIKRGKIEKTSETKCKSKGRSYSAPKPV